jgi:hypothetical protein
MRQWLNLSALAAATILASAASSAIGADESTNSMVLSKESPWEKGSVSLGGFVSVFNSDLSFGLNNAPGVKINAEDVFGLQSTLTVFRANALYRPGESRRNQLDFDYAAYHRSGEATLSSSLTIDGTTYPVGAHVSTIFNFDIIRGTYSYAFIQNDRMRIAAGLGIYAVPLKYGLEIQTSGGLSSVGGADTTLPLPALALRTEFLVVPKVYVNAGFDAMYLEVSNFQGSLLDASMSVEYRPWKHVGFGLGYSYMGLNVKAQNSNSSYPGVNFVGTVDVRFDGLLFYGKYTF